ATFVGTVTLMLLISPLLTLLALVPLVLVSVLVRRYGRQIHDRFERVQAQLSDLNAIVQENLAGARVVPAYVQKPHREGPLARTPRGGGSPARQPPPTSGPPAASSA